MEIADEPATWTDLMQQLAGASEEWLFRGQENFDWKLATRLERDLARWPLRVDEGAKLEAEAEALNTFVAKARHVLPEIHEEDYLGWLSVMQHYGAPTRLLDWTRSPFVACYFSCCGPGNEDGAIWMLHEPHCRLAHGDIAPETAGFKVFRNSSGQATISYSGQAWKRQSEAAVSAMMNRDSWPLVVVPGVADERIRAQQGLFTFHGNLSALASECPTRTLWTIPQAAHAVGEPGLIEFLSGRAFGGGPGSSDSLVRKVRIKSAWRGQIIAALQRMNITPDSLFPGLDGIGRAATLQVQHGASLRKFESESELREILAEVRSQSWADASSTDAQQDRDSKPEIE